MMTEIKRGGSEERDSYIKNKDKKPSTRDHSHDKVCWEEKRDYEMDQSESNSSRRTEYHSTFKGMFIR